MSTIGNLVVNMGLNANPLMSGLGSVRGALGSLGGLTSGLTGKIAGIGGALVGLAGIGTFGAMATHAFAAIDATAKLSDSLGTTTETLVGLQHASDLSGNSQESLTKGLNKLQKGMGAIQNGGKGPTDTLKSLGLNAQEIAKKDTGEAFLDIADRIADIESPAQKAAAAIAIFGKGGQELLPLLNEGRDGLADIIKESDDLGLSFNRMDAAKVEEANDAMTRVKASIQGLANQFVIAVAPFLTQFANGLTQIIPLATGVFLWLSDTILTAFDVAGWAIANWQEVALLGFKSAELGVIKFGSEISYFFTGVLPALFDWFTKNWHDVWFTATDMALTVLINFGENVQGIMKSVWDFISSGGRKPLELSWKPLTEGFVNTIRALPEIPKREIGALEMELQTDVSRMSDNLGGSLSSFLDEQKKARDQAGQPSDLGPQGPGLTPDIAGKATKGEVKGPEALRVDSAEAFKAIARASLNRTDQQLTKKSLQVQEDMNENLAAIRSALEEGGDGDFDFPS